MEIIKCKRCKKEKNENEFKFWRGKITKSCNQCREKNNEWYAEDLGGRRTRQKNWYNLNKEKRKKYRSDLRLDRKYSLTREVWNEMLAGQNNKCKICERSFKEYKPCVDHNHENGKVRGLLCRKCNLDLQSIEKKDFLKKALLYLNEYMK